MTVDDALRAARAAGVDRLDAALLLAHRSGHARTWLIAHGDAALEAAVAETFLADCRRRADGVPLAYLTGHREFFGLSLKVSPDVLVPRPETELLVGWALELLAGELGHLARPAVVDLGTGSGAIALAIASHWPRAQVTAVDADPAALDVARRNAARLGLPVRWLLGDWWRPLGGSRADLALANPPYVAEDDPHLHALRHEPCSALAAAEDGLAQIRRIAAGAPEHLRGWLLVEHGWNQEAAVRQALETAGGHRIETRHDLAGHPRCSAARFGASAD